MNIFQIFKPIMGLLGWKPVNTVLSLPEPIKIFVKRIHNNNCKAMILAKDPKKTALAVYVPPPDCKTNVINTFLVIVVAWTVILGTARLFWLWLKNRLMSKRREGQEEENNVPLDVQACKADAFFDCQPDEQIVLIDCDEEKIISFDVQSKNDFPNDSTGVFFNLGSDKKEADLNLESQEKNECVVLESDEKNGFPYSPSYEDVFPDLPSDEEEGRLKLKSKEEFPKIPSDEERISSLPPSEEKRFLLLESEEKVLPDLASEEKGSSKNERFPDLSSDEEERFPTMEYEEKVLPSDFPSDEKVSPYLLSDEMELFLYLESKKESFPDLSSDEEEFKKEGFPDLLSNDKAFSDMTSDEQEIFLYFKSKEKWFPDLPSDEERLPDLLSDKKVKLPFLEAKEGRRDLPTNF